MDQTKAPDIRFVIGDAKFVYRGSGVISFEAAPGTKVVVAYPFIPRQRKSARRKGKRRGGAWWNRSA